MSALRRAWGAVALLAVAPAWGAEAPRRAAGQCSPPRADDPVLLAVIASDPALVVSTPGVERALRRASKDQLRWLPAAETQRALSAEGGHEEREAVLVNARVLIGRAEDRFRELDDEQAQNILVGAIAPLTAAHFEPGGTELLARAHLLAGAIFLARGRSDAAKQRLQRALDLDPELTPPRDRFAPEVLAELAAVRAQSATRPVGRLIVGGRPGATVYIDGQERGQTPLTLDALGSGNHVVRVYAPAMRSFVTTLQLGPAEEQQLNVELAPDEELRQLAELPARVRAGMDIEDALSLLARRAGGAHAILAVSRLSGHLTLAGTPTVAVELHVRGGSVAYAPTLAADELEAALKRALRCGAAVEHAPERARPLDGAPTLAARLEPIPDPEPLWRAPWFWGAAAMLTMVASGALLFARASSGPPEAVEITLIPRP